MGTSLRINKIKQHFIERHKRDGGKAKVRDEQAKTLRDHQPLARLAFIALIGMLLYLSTVAYNTSHLDLLLNTKVGVVWSLVELPRRWVLGVGSLVLVVIHYEAISLHHRVNRQFTEWLVALPESDEKKTKSLLWLHGGLISDTYSSAIFGKLLATLARFVLYGVLWIAPLFTLTFVQAVVMPVHSEWLSWSVRLSLLMSVMLVVYSAMQGRHLRHHLSSRWIRMRLGLATALLLCASTLFLSLHVFLWPGEELQQRQTAMAPKAWVWDPRHDDPWTYRYFLTISCGSKRLSDQDRSNTGADEYQYSGQPTTDYDYKNTNYSGWKRKPFDVFNPQSVRADWGNMFSYVYPIKSEWQCPSLDDATMVSTQILRALISHNSKYFSPNFDLDGEVINGRGLSIVERQHLSTHTDEQPLHPKFYEVLSKLQTLNLSEENLRFANFCNAWLPKTEFPSGAKLSGINFCSAQLQGSKLLIGSMLNESGLQPILANADISAGEIVGAKFTTTTAGFTAIAALIQGIELAVLAQADWRKAQITQPAFLQYTDNYGKKYSQIKNSRFDGATFSSPQFHATVITDSTFVGATISNPLFFSGTEFVNSDFSLANFAMPSERYAGENLVSWKNTTFDLMQIPISALSKHSFTTQATSKPKYPLVTHAIEAMDSSNKVGPLLISEPRMTNAEIAKLGRINNNFWLVQAQTRPDKTIQDKQDYSDLLKWCQQGGKVCNGFSSSLQSTATWAFTQMCYKYAIYMADDIANTLYTATYARQPSDLHGNYQLYNDAERKKFMGCLKNIHGQHRHSQSGSVNPSVFK